MSVLDDIAKNASKGMDKITAQNEKAVADKKDPSKNPTP